MENVSVVTQAVRTLLALAVVAALGSAGWYGYQWIDARDDEAQRAAMQLANAERQIAELETLAARQAAEIDRLDTAMRLLKVDHRVARLTVLDQMQNEGQETISLIEFQELGEDGEPLGEARQFRLRGDVAYIDSWVVKFEDKYIEQADLHRSTALVLFRRLFGENQTPAEGFVLDQVGSRPEVYGRGGVMSDWERQIWDDFWSVANNRAKQEALGIRAAHGEAPSIKLQEGKSYRITLRASGGLTISPEAPSPRPAL